MIISQILTGDIFKASFSSRKVTKPREDFTAYCSGCETAR